MSKPKQLQDLVFALRQCKGTFSDEAISKLGETINECSKNSTLITRQKGSLAYLECLASLTELLNRSEIPCVLREQATGLLSAFIQDEDSKLLLEEELNLTRSLLSALNKQPSENLQIQILKLLQEITYGSRLTWIETEEKYGLRFVHVILDKLVEHPNGPIFEVSLGILVNLCRNFAIQNYVTNIEHFSLLKKLLVQNLTTDNLRIILYSMTLIFHLSSNDEKVFSARNIRQTLEVIFNTLVNKTSEWTPYYAADLLMDLARSSRTKALLENYQYLSQCLTNVLTLLCQKERRIQQKCLQLLLAFCAVSPPLRRAVADLVFASDTVQADDRFSRLLDQPDAARKESPLFALTHIVTGDNSREAELAANLLRDLYEDLVASRQSLNPRLELVDRTLAAVPTSCPNASPLETQRLARKWVYLLQLMTILCDVDAWLGLVTARRHAEALERLVRGQLSGNPIATALRLPAVTPPPALLPAGAALPGADCEGGDAAHDGARLALHALHFMYAVVERRSGDGPYEVLLSSLLQEAQAAPLLAYGIVCGRRDCVQLAFQLTAAALLLDDFSVSALGEHVNNFTQDLYRSQLKTTSPPNLATAAARKTLRPRVADENQPPLGSGDKAPLEDTIEQLVHNFQTGTKGKDLKHSDLLALYEHKLQTLQTKETHLEDLLSTKTMALAQADALIVKYRSRMALSDSENQKLRVLLLDYERQGERNQESIRQLEQSVQELRREKSHVTSELKKSSGKLQETTDALKKSQEQSKKLQDNLNETSASLKKALEKVKRLQEECATKTKTIAELDKNIDSYRSRLDEAEHTIKEAKKQVNKYSEITKLINSLTVDPSSGDAAVAALQSSHSSSG